MLLKSGLVS